MSNPCQPRRPAAEGIVLFPGLFKFQGRKPRFNRRDHYIAGRPTEMLALNHINLAPGGH